MTNAVDTPLLLPSSPVQPLNAGPAHSPRAAYLAVIASSAATVEASQMWAADGDEPVEAQALVVAGRGITLAHDLDVVIEPDQIAVRPLTRPGHARHVQVAFLPGHRSTAIAAAIDALREIGRRRALRA